MSGIELTELEKERIYLEEFYRREIQEALAPPPKPPSRLKSALDFLNSHLGMWLLTTVAVGVIASLYGGWQDARAEENRRRKEVERIDREMITRIRGMIQLLNSTGDDEPVKALRTLSASPSDTRDGSLSWTLKPIHGTDPEYASFATGILLLRLRDNLDGAAKAEIQDAIVAWYQMLRIRDEALTKYGSLSRQGTDASKAAMAQTINQAALDIGAKLKSGFRLGRWSLEPSGEHALDLVPLTPEPPDADDLERGSTGGTGGETTGGI